MFQNSLCVYSLVLAACTCTLNSCAFNKLSENTNSFQVLLGRPAIESKHFMGGYPKITTGTIQDGKALWSFEFESHIPHYVPAETHTTTSYDSYTNTVTSHTTSTEAYTYYTHYYAGYVVTMDFLKDRVVKVDYHTRNFDDLANSQWKNANFQILRWNAYAANDSLDMLKEAEAINPYFTTEEMRLKGCLQAAKYDAIDVLVYYLRDCKVPLDKAAETWAYGEGSNHDSRSDSGTLVLTKASVREILRTKNSPKVIKALQEFGLL